MGSFGIRTNWQKEEPERTVYYVGDSTNLREIVVTLLPCNSKLECFFQRNYLVVS